LSFFLLYESVKWWQEVLNFLSDYNSLSASCLTSFLEPIVNEKSTIMWSLFFLILRRTLSVLWLLFCWLSLVGLQLKSLAGGWSGPGSLSMWSLLACLSQACIGIFFVNTNACWTWLVRQFWKDQHYLAVTPLLSVLVNDLSLVLLLYTLMSSIPFFFFSLKYINVAMVTILKNMTNILTAIGELYLFRKRQTPKVWTAMFLMVNGILRSYLFVCCYFQTIWV